MPRRGFATDHVLYVRMTILSIDKNSSSNLASLREHDRDLLKEQPHTLPLHYVVLVRGRG